MSSIRNKGSQNSLSTWVKQWNFTSRTENPCHQQSLWWSSWRARPVVNIGHVAAGVVTGEPGSSWKSNRVQGPGPTIPSFSWSTQNRHCPLALLSWGENCTTYFFQSTCKTKNLTPNILSQVKTFQDLRNAHSPKTLFLTRNFIGSHWFQKGSGWSGFLWALCSFHGFNFRRFLLASEIQGNRTCWGSERQQFGYGR